MADDQPSVTTEPTADLSDHVRVPLPFGKGCEAVPCGSCGATKRNLAFVVCAPCGDLPLCRGCDKKFHGSGPAVPDMPPRFSPPMYLLIHAVAKKANGRGIIRSAVALGVEMVIIAGSDKSGCGQSFFFARGQTLD